MDLQSLNDGLAVFRSGMDGIRTALMIWKDIKGTLPAEHREELEKAFEASEQQFKVAEAQIAKGLGYELCRCEYPPTPMLTIGWINGRNPHAKPGPVHQCPKCGIRDNAGASYTKTGNFTDR